MAKMKSTKRSTTDATLDGMAPCGHVYELGEGFSEHYRHCARCIEILNKDPQAGLKPEPKRQERKPTQLPPAPKSAQLILFPKPKEGECTMSVPLARSALFRVAADKQERGTISIKHPMVLASTRDIQVTWPNSRLNAKTYGSVFHARLTPYVRIR